MRDHKKLRAFELADELVLGIYAVTKGFPAEERFGLTSQIRRAAVSIASNIVEGCTRISNADYMRFIEIAYGSAKEVEYQFSIAHRLGYLSESDFKTVNSVIVETCKVLNGLLRALRTNR